MEYYLIPWIITVIKMVIIGLLVLLVTGIVDNYMPKRIKEKIVELITKKREE